MFIGLKFRKWRDYTICVAKTKVLISCAVITRLIRAFVFAYSKSRFSHDEAHTCTYFFFGGGGRPFMTNSHVDILRFYTIFEANNKYCSDSREMYEPRHEKTGF